MSSTQISCSCSRTIISSTRFSIIIPNNIGFYSVPLRRGTRVRIGGGVRASILDSSQSSSSNFAKRIETAWLISQQPRPVACTSCHSNGHVECKWCGGTGFFILGDNMLCQVPSQNTSCVICAGKGSVSCADCKGTGFRAKWLDDLPVSKQ